MGDSDEEFDRRRGRDKFRGERNDYERRPRDYRENRRGREDSWQERKRGESSWDWQDKRPRDGWESRKRGDSGSGYYREMDRNRRDMGGRPGSPPMKRLRRDNWKDYDDYHGGGGGMPPGGMGMWPHADVGAHSLDNPPRPDNFHDKKGELPRMMTFKEFLIAQEDDINETEAVRRYKEYTMEFKRTQISDFFVLHKTEEWLKEKYHPIDKQKKAKETSLALKRRLRVFLDLLDEGVVDSMSLDHTQHEQLIKFMDTVVIKLEGGGSDEIALLDDSMAASTDKTGVPAESKSQVTPTSSSTVVSEGQGIDSTADTTPQPTTSSPGKTKKRRRSQRGSFYSEGDDDNIEDDELDSASDSDSGLEAEVAKSDVQEATANADDERKTAADEEPSSTSNDDNVSHGAKNSAKDDGCQSNDVVSSESDVVDASANETDTAAAAPSVASSSVVNSNADGSAVAADDTKEKAEVSTEQAGNSDKGIGSTSDIQPAIKVQPLHKTLSLFIRHVLPSITKEDIVTLCKRYPGFMRVAVSEPSPERRFGRRGWITFQPDVNIKDICWNLSNIRLKDSELNPIVNRDLSKRVRPISGLTVSQFVVRSDVDLAVQLIRTLDDKHQLYAEEEEEDAVVLPNKAHSSSAGQQGTSEKQRKPSTEDATSSTETTSTTPAEGVTSSGEEETEQVAFVHQKLNLPQENPVLALLDGLTWPDETNNSTDEADALPGAATAEKTDPTADSKQLPNTLNLTQHEHLYKALDKLLLYLRVVHSVDYYNGTDYAYEDEMPNRCGIIHVRGVAPEKATIIEAKEWTKNLEQKLSSHLKTEQEKLNEEDANALGKKSVEVETENFIKANSQELAKDKWLCPLSGKKFCGPEFVRKHIFNKHSDKLEEVKQEVEFFNTYLSDPNRPHFPDPPPNKSSGGMHASQAGLGHGGSWPQRGPRMYGARNTFTPPFGNFAAGPDVFHRGHGNFPQKPRAGGHHRDPRQIVEYRDLDAPDDTDFF